MYCNNCGKKINNQEEFCVKCGNAIAPLPNNPSTDSYNSSVANVKEKTLTGRKLLVVVISVVSIIIGVLYLFPYFSVSSYGETLTENWFSSSNFVFDEEGIALFNIIAGSVIITMLLLVGSALHSLLKKKISILAIPALIISILSALIIFEVIASDMININMTELYGKDAVTKITPAPYIILILSIAAFVVVMLVRFKKKQD